MPLLPPQLGISQEAMLDSFLAWVKELHLELYPAQEEAVLEIMSGKNLILNTPTGSGKSLVATAMHYKALCEGARSFYTSPIKALVSEKFFDLCDIFGAENVGMLTGDASINRDAPLCCCTAEILANMALREGRHTSVDFVIMDEFHYFADRDRGMAWQIPLLLLADATFMLLSATLGDMRETAQRLESLTGREVAIVRSTDRPVPLDFEYREKPIHDTLDDLLKAGKAPVYMVNFTQRDAAEQAQNLTSINFCSKEQKKAIAEATAGFRFDTPYGKDVRRYVRHGIGIHHAGLLPKYRLLVEQLSQKGHLKVICGTDTLGVGVNIPIRTVLFTKLCKFDGQKVGILGVRDFHQIGGRAGRKGFDDRGSVVCQAPEHVVENKRMLSLAGDDPKKRKKVKLKKPPQKGHVHYDVNTFNKLIQSDPEPLRSQFQITHGVLVNLLDRQITYPLRDGGYRKVVALISASHESERSRKRHRRHAAVLFRALRKADLIERVEPTWSSRPAVRVKEDLQRNFSLLHTLSLYLIDSLYLLDAQLESYPLDLLSLVEAILESPRLILIRQEQKLKDEIIAQLKAEGVPYEERMAELEKVTYPKPNADFIYDSFDRFRESHPWVRSENVSPKSIVREMHELYATFNDYVDRYGLQRSEGVLLRYLSSAYKALVQTVPDSYKTPEVHAIIGYLRAVLANVDSSLVQEWESLLAGGDDGAVALPERPEAVVIDPKTLRARMRAEILVLVKALAQRNYEEAVLLVRKPADPDEAWTAERFEHALAPFYQDYERLVFDARARYTEFSRIEEVSLRHWRISQTLLDPQDDNMWAIEAEVDLSDPEGLQGNMLEIKGIGA